MNIFEITTIIVVSYLFGSFSFARIVTRIWSGKDVTEFEIPIDGEDERYKVLSIGANSVSSELGAGAGMLVSFLDILKVGIPVFLASYFFPDEGWSSVMAGISGMTGHIWPIYYRFHGGSGYSAIIGGLLVLDPLAILVTPIAGLALGMLVFRNMIVATVSWIWLLIPWFWFRDAGNIPGIIYAVAVNILFILAMIPDIKIGLKYKKEGKVDAYGRGSLSSNPMGRGYMKMAKALGFMQDTDDLDDEEKGA
jgi:glycerol-3-phosphate acyltransferase PlsY